MKYKNILLLLLLSISVCGSIDSKPSKTLTLEEMDSKGVGFQIMGTDVRLSVYHNLNRMAYNISCRRKELDNSNFTSGELTVELYNTESKKYYKMIYPFTSKKMDKVTGTLPDTFVGAGNLRPDDLYFWGNLRDYVPQEWLFKTSIKLDTPEGEKNSSLTVKMNCIVGDSKRKFAENIDLWEKQAKKGNPMAMQLYDTTLAWHKKFSPAMDKLHPWGYPGKANEAFKAAYAASEPSSPYYKDPDTIQYALDAINFLISELDEKNGAWWFPHRRAWKSNDPNTNRFTLYPLADAIYCIMRLEQGQKELAKWKEPLRKAVDLQYAVWKSGMEKNELGQKSKALNIAGHGGTWGARYLNQDVMVLLAEALAGKILNEPQRLKNAHEILEIIKTQILPAGGFHYIYNTDESAGYYPININIIARYGTISADPLAKEVIQLTENYYLNVMSKEGIVECWSDVWWKQAWADCDIPSLVIVASCAKERKQELQALLLARLQRQAPCKNYNHTWFYAAPYWDGFKRGKALPSESLVYDKEGKTFRGRYHSWNYGVGLGRHMRNNFSGGVISRDDTIGAFDGAMSGANFRVIPMAGKPLFLANTESRETTYAITQIPNRGAVMAISYVPQANIGTVKMGDANEPWKVKQILLADKTGNCGLITATATENTKGWVKQLIGEISFVRHYLEATGENSFKIGSLNSKIYETNMGKPQLGTGGHGNKVAVVLDVPLKRMAKSGEEYFFSYWVGAGAAPKEFKVLANKDGYMVNFDNGEEIIVMENLSTETISKTVKVAQNKPMKVYCGEEGKSLDFEKSDAGIIVKIPAKSVAVVTVGR